MEQKQAALLQFLSHRQNEWTTAAALSVELNISVRSVKNYICRLNDETPGLIASSSKGFQLQDREKAAALSTDNKSVTIQTPEQCSYTVKKHKKI